MKFADHAALNLHTNRLQSASAAMMTTDASMKEEVQVFDFAGHRFVGPDAMLLKRCLFQALGGIAEDATNALKKGGISFDGMEGEAPQGNRKQRRTAQAGKKAKG